MTEFNPTEYSLDTKSHTISLNSTIEHDNYIGYLESVKGFLTKKSQTLSIAKDFYAQKIFGTDGYNELMDILKFCAFHFIELGGRLRFNGYSVTFPDVKYFTEKAEITFTLEQKVQLAKEFRTSILESYYKNTELAKKAGIEFNHSPEMAEVMKNYIKVRNEKYKS